MMDLIEGSHSMRTPARRGGTLVGWEYLGKAGGHVASQWLVAGYL